MALQTAQSVTGDDKPHLTHQENYLEVEKPEEDSNEKYQGALDYSGAHAKDDPAEIRLVRKLDLFILPTLWIMYWFNYLDRNAITVARLDGLEDELGLSSVEYQTCVSILFVGYLLGQIPSNMIITRIRPSIYMGAVMALWAVVSTLTAIAQDFKGLLLTRFFLGVTEAPYYPGALYVLSIFYTRKEIATRISILFTANICGTAFAGLIAIGVFQMSGMAGLSGWRWLFIIQGILTFILAIVSIFILPDEPLTTHWLSPAERQLAHDRMRRDTVDLQDNTSAWTGLKDAAKDPKMWLLLTMQFFHIGAANFKNFFPTIVNTMGFSRNITLALTCPPYLLAGAVAIAYSWNSGRMNERTWHVVVAKMVAVFGFVLACATLNAGARYFAMCTFATGVYACNSIIVGWVAATCGQTKEKKASALALVNTFAAASPIFTAYLWPTSDSPRYTIAMSTSAAFSLLAAILAYVMRRVLIKENRKIRQNASEAILFYAY